jgi:hypothetical protein
LTSFGTWAADGWAKGGRAGDPRDALKMQETNQGSEKKRNFPRNTCYRAIRGI